MHVIILICLIPVLAACKNQQLADQKNIRIADTTFTRDIPLTSKGDTVRHHRIVQIFENSLGLPSLENGVEQKEIRVWYNYARQDSAQLVRLRESANGWTAQLYTFKISFAGTTDSIVSVGKSVRAGNPSSGWKQFIDSLERYGILTLPDYNKLENYRLAMDASSTYVQVADKHQYRLYGYIIPLLNRPDIKEADKMESILELIEREFNFKKLAII
jgi:hypothetical protein